MITLNQNSNYLQKVVVLLLVLVLLFNAAIAPADASVTLTAATIAVVGAALVASGLTFTAAEDMTEAVHSLWDSLSDEQQSAFLVLASNAAAVVPNSKPFVFKLTNNLITGITSWISSLGATAESSTVSIPKSGTNGVIFSANFKDLPLLNMKDGQKVITFFETNPDLFVQIFSNLYITKWCYNWDSSCAISLVYNTSLYGLQIDSLFFPPDNYLPYNTDFPFLLSLSPSETRVGHYWIVLCDSFGVPCVSSGSLCRIGTFSTEQLAEMGINVDDYFTEETSTSISLAPDYTPGFSGSKELDSDTDVVVPTGTGKLLHDGAIDSDFVGTFTPDMARDASAEAEGELTTVLDWVKSIATSISTFFDVSQFSLDFSPFQVGLSSVFPFCIPFDFFKGVKLFSASAADFSFDIDLETDYFTIDHTVDLSPFRIPILFFRYIVVFWFSWILISRTRDLMKW